jgi:hypothetical protein
VLERVVGSDLYIYQMKRLRVSSASEAIRHQHPFRFPLFIIARKQQGYRKVREKVFL